MTTTAKKHKLIGDKAFYKMVLAVAVPIMIQNGISNLVGMLDNIMVGRVGTEEMSGVSIVNQLIFVYNLCIFGGVSGVGIFTAQYFGQKDDNGIRHTFRYKIWMGLILTAVAIVIFLVTGEPLIQMYLKGSSDGGDPAVALYHGKRYLWVMLVGFIPFVFRQIYSSTLRECGETVVPMVAGIAAIGVNLVLNYLLIFGKFGFPTLGVVGAAVATVISRFVEAAIVIIWTHRHPEKNSYIVGMYKTLKVPVRLAKNFFLKGVPLLVNETLWGMGQAMLTQCYSLRGLNVIAALNIANTLNNVFMVVYLALGDAVAIIVGQLLGAGKMEEARDTDNKLIAFSVFSCVIVAAALVCVAPFFPQIYNTEAVVKTMATQILFVQAVFMPQNAFLHATYFTLRSGGKTIVTFVFDSVFVWAVSVPVAYFLSRYTGLYIVWMLVLLQMCEWIKCLIGFILVKKGVWMQNIVD